MSTSHALSLETFELTKRFGAFAAMDAVSLKVRPGTVHALLGENGAGKSTLVKILMTVIKPTRATGTVLGRGVGHKPTLGRVGYLPEHHRFPDYLTGRQVVEFYGAMGGVDRRDRKKRGAELLDFVGMSKWADTRVRGYSKGMRQRVGIAQTLVNNPDLVIWDEPTDGVDPVGRRDIREMTVELKRRGTTVMLNSHLLSELEMVCDRVAILVQGRVSSQGSVAELTIDRQRYEIEVVSEDSNVDTAIRNALARWLTPGSLTGTLATGESLHVQLDGAHAPALLKVNSAEAGVVQPLIDALRSARLTVRAVKPIRPSLEDLFMEAVTDPNTGRALAPGAKEGI